ncbi:MAG: lipopolysaccharide heptosyltransferase [Chlamydiota bacterium]|jgi:heptosyltransferase-3
MSYGDYPDLFGVKKILVIKLRQLGDVLLTTPLLRHLKEALPYAKISLLVYEEARPLVEGLPWIDEIIGWDRKAKGLRKGLSLFFQCWRQNYDLVLNLTEGDRGVFLSFVSRAKVRAGFVPKGRLQKKMLTHLVKHCPGVRHTVERNLDVLRRLGLSIPQPRHPVSIARALKSAQKIQRRLEGQPFILIHPTSRWRFKCWPHMRELVKALVGRGHRVVISSGPDPVEVAIASEIARDLPLLSFAGQLALSDLTELIAASSLLVTVDSLPLHMASALGARVVVLFGSTSEITWGPWQNDRAHVITKALPCRPCYMDGCGGSKRSDCLELITCDDVMALLESKVFPEVRAACLGRGDQLIQSPR